MDCSVCVEKFNKSSRKKIVCGCGFKVCEECARRYLLQENQEAGCMSCKIKWPRKFLVSNFSKVFINKEYKKFRENLFLEREMGMMPATQPFVESRLEAESIKNKLLELKSIKRDIECQIFALEIELNNKKIRSKDIKGEFVRQCPSNDCRGFLNKTLKCGLCHITACGSCREIKGDNHSCDPNVVETIKLLKNETKPCPKCGILIYKIEGCPQMYCMPSSGGCGIAFSWDTLMIEKGPIHNPHYYEYQRQMNNGVVERQPGDTPMCQELNFFGVRSMIIKFDKKTGNILRNTVHIKEVVITPLNNNLELKNRDSRIDYMLNKIDKEKLKNLVQKRQKNEEKKNEIQDCLSMYVTSMTDLFFRLYADMKNKTIIIEMENLRKYVNQCLLDISVSYNSKKMHLNEEFLLC